MLCIDARIDDVTIVIGSIAHDDGNFEFVEVFIEQNPIVWIVAFAARAGVAILVDGEFAAIANFVERWDCCFVVFCIGVVFADVEHAPKLRADAAARFRIKIASDDDVIIPLFLFCFDFLFERCQLRTIIFAVQV